MSHLLYSTRLYWAGTRGGVAKLHGRIVMLLEAPDLPGLDVVAIDYVPEIGLRSVMPYGAGWRDMTEAEVLAADEFLAGKCPPQPA